MNQVPFVVVKNSVVQNWEEIKTWAGLNSVYWRNCDELAKIQKLSENEYLKLLASTLLHEAGELRSRLMRVMTETGWTL